MRMTRGRLTDAMSPYRRGLAMATGGAPVVARGADMHVGISRILRQRDDLGGATQHLGQSEELGDANGLPQNPHRSRVAMAGV